MEAASVGIRATGASATVRAVVATLSLGAAAIHFSTVGQHGWWLFDAGFLTMGAFQIAFAIAILLHPRRWVLWAGLAGNAAIVATWAVAHSLGLPFGPGAGEAEPSGLKDLTATAFELLMIVGALVLLRPGLAPALGEVRVPAWASGLLLGAAALAAGLAVATPHGPGPHTQGTAHEHDTAVAGDSSGHSGGHHAAALDGWVGAFTGGTASHATHGDHRGGAAGHDGGRGSALGGSHAAHSALAALGLGAGAHHGSAAFAVSGAGSGHVAGHGHGASTSTGHHSGSGGHGDSGGIAGHGDGHDRGDRRGDHRSSGHGGRRGDHDRGRHGGHGRHDGEGHGDLGGSEEPPDGIRLGSYTAAWHDPEPARDGEPAKGAALVFHERESSGETGHHGEEPCNPTREQEQAAHRLYVETAAAIEKYDNHPERALADGFVTAPIVADRIIHMGNRRRINDPTVLDPQEIEALVYAVTDRGLSLVAGLYLMPKAGMNGPEIGGCRTQWHNHTGGVALLASAGTRTELPQMMHVWTYPGLDPYGHYNGRTISQLWTPGRWIPSVCRESSNPNSGCLP